MSVWSIILISAIGIAAVIWVGRGIARARHSELDRVIGDISEHEYDELQDKDTPSSQDRTISWVSFYLATDKPWNGKDVVASLMRHGMVLDQDNLFSFNIEGVTWFRAAQATQPVSFDMERINDTAIAGLAFFMDANDVDYPREAFNKMVFVIKTLSSELNGLLVDQSRRALLPEDLERIAKQLPKYDDELVG
jgi:cell division protein ZipA